MHSDTSVSLFYLTLVSVISILPQAAVFWNEIVSLFPNDNGKTANVYVASLPLNFDTGDYKYGLLVELGINFHDVDLDVEMVVDRDFVVLSEYWDLPHQEKPSADAQRLDGAIVIDNKGSVVTLGKVQIIEHDVESPTYRIKTKTVMMTLSRSYYVVFAGNGKLKLLNTYFNGELLD